MQQQQATTNNMSSNFKIPAKCKFCGSRFIAKTTVTQYCTLNCARRAYKQRKREEKLQYTLEQTSLQEPVKTENGGKEYFSISEATQMLGASRWTIYRLITNGKLKAAKLGSRTIIQKTDIDKLFK